MDLNTVPLRDWEEAFERAAQAGYGEKIAVEADDIPPQFTRSILSLPLGSRVQYRDNKVTDTYHIREYDTHYTVELDRFHPRAAPIRHALTDVVSHFL